MTNPISWFTGRHAGRSFLAPTVVILLSLTIFPFFFALYLTVGDVSMMGGLSISFAGVKNWIRLFQDARFYNALYVTLFIAFICVAVEYLLGLGLAFLLNRKIKGRHFFMVTFLLPMMLAPIAVGYIARMMFHQTRGPVNYALQLTGLPAVEWLTSTEVAIYSIMIADVWQWTPFMLLILFAGLQTIPDDVKEAARIDGASEWQRFRHVIFPMLIPASIAALLIRTLEVFKIIDKIYIMTGGGPGISTESLTYMAYDVGLNSFDLDYGSTIATSLFVVVLVITILFFLATRKYVAQSRY